MVGNPFVKFVESCPNVESITAAESGQMGPLASCGKNLKKLKRVAGVDERELWQGMLRVTFCSGRKCMLTDGATKLHRASRIYRRSAFQI